MHIAKNRWLGGWARACVRVAAVGIGIVTGTGAMADDLLPRTDNAAPPFMGIYDGPPSSGIAATDEYARWLNRTTVWGHGSNNWDDWKNIDRAGFLYRPWGAWVAAAPGRRVVFSISLFPKGGSLEQGAAGAYDAHYATLAQTLVANGLGSSILRLGWEFNGSWYPWKVLSAQDAKQFVDCWQHAVDAIRAVPGTAGLTFCWNGCNESTAYPLEAAYPGDGYVDYVGTDVYDVSWAKGTYPYPADATEEERVEIQQRAWDVWIHPAAPKNGIMAWQAVAKAHRKPFVIPEWGLETKQGHGGYDDPWFIERMHRLIHDPVEQVYFASYWNAKSSKVVPTGGSTSAYPKATAMFQKLFSLPAAAP
jgi:hypothetical protein